MRKIIPLILTATLALAGCSSIDCPLNNTVYMKIMLQGTNKPLADTLSVTTRKEVGKDSVFINRQVNTDSLMIPMSYKQDEDVLYFVVNTTTGRTFIDTVSIKKENQVHFESMECQPSFFHTITDVRTTHNYIDSIVINNKEVNYDATKPHFHLYFGTRN